MATKRRTFDFLLDNVGQISAQISSLVAAASTESVESLNDIRILADQIQEIAAELKNREEKRRSKIWQKSYATTYKRKVTFAIPRPNGNVCIFTTYYT